MRSLVRILLVPSEADSFGSMAAGEPNAGTSPVEPRTLAQAWRAG